MIYAFEFVFLVKDEKEMFASFLSLVAPSDFQPALSNVLMPKVTSVPAVPQFQRLHTGIIAGYGWGVHLLILPC